jgi:hypothetical protein
MNFKNVHCELLPLSHIIAWIIASSAFPMTVAANASPQTFQRVKSFKTHRKGPIFSDEIRSAGSGEGRSRYLRKLMKEKMKRIYPRLATKKFSAEHMKQIQ